MSWIHGSRVDVDAETPGTAAALAAEDVVPDIDAELSGWLAEAIFQPPKGADPVCGANLSSDWTGETVAK